jgi:serine/threonine-protein kinase
VSGTELHPNSDEDAFLQAIAAAPEDDAPRLVYADWLEERGDPRAEYLRLLCAATATADEAVGARLRELRSGLDPTWAAAVQPPGLFAMPWYTIVREVAQGVLTTVYEATHKHPNFAGRRQALKVLTHRQYAEQFMNACRISAALQHPHIPPLHQVAEDPLGRLFSARAFVDGHDLQQNIGRAAHDPVEVARIISAIAGALGHAHGLGIVHGYVHPRHLLLGGDGSPHLIGFGEFPPPDVVAPGNPLHLAPEQLEAVGVGGPGTDVYQLAESAAWLLVGRHPFASVLGVDELRAAKRARNLWAADRGMAARLPDRVEPVLRRALSPNPADRYQTPVEFAEAFAAAVRRGAPGRPWWRIW